MKAHNCFLSFCQIRNARTVNPFHITTRGRLYSGTFGHALPTSAVYAIFPLGPLRSYEENGISSDHLWLQKSFDSGVEAFYDARKHIVRLDRERNETTK